MKHPFSFRKLLVPGMGIKRWLSLAFLGLLLAACGLMLLSTHRTPLMVEFAIVDFFDNLGLSVRSSVIDLALIIIGLFLALWAAQRCVANIERAVVPQNADLIGVIYNKRRLGRGSKIVAIGGGTGLSTLLRGLKKHTSNIAAIVSVSDDGGSSGRLTKEMNMLPPGDLRHCMTALADDESLISELFQYRFATEGDLSKHSFGNLFLAALNKICDDNFLDALDKASQILGISGRVLPATLTPTTLCAKLRDGRVIKGESDIPEAMGEITDVYLEPEHCSPPEEVFKALKDADAIVLGPGSLYTSVMPPLLIDGIPEAIRNSKAPKIYVCNVMTQPGETDGYTAADHLQAIYHHVGGPIVDYIIVNSAQPQKLLEKYKKEGAHPIEVDRERLETMQVMPRLFNLVSEKEQVRHDSDYLAESIMEVLAKHKDLSQIKR